MTLVSAARAATELNPHLEKMPIVDLKSGIAEPHFSILIQQLRDLALSASLTRNLARNGDFLIKQFGASFPNLTGGYAADRCYVSAPSGNAVSFVTAPIAGSGCRYGLKFQRSPGQTWTGTAYFVQTFTSEESTPYAGKELALSLFARAGSDCSNPTVNINMFSGTGTNQTSANFQSWTGRSVFAQGALTMSTSGAQGLITGTVPASATQIGIYADWTPSGTAGADDSITITGWDLREGDWTPDVYEQKPFDQEYADCALFYEDMAVNPLTGAGWLRVIADGAANGTGGGVGTQQQFMSVIRFKTKRHNTHTLTTGPSSTWHITVYGNTSYYDLSVVQWGHQTLEDALVLFEYTIDAIDSPAFANGTPYVLALDGTPGCRWAINANL